MVVALVRDWLARGVEVRIFTARVMQDAARVAVVKQRCVELFGRELKITNVKDDGCLALYDDIAFRVEANTGKLLDGRHDG
jgi:hypothetical protein